MHSLFMLPYAATMDPRNIAFWYGSVFCAVFTLLHLVFAASFNSKTLHDKYMDGAKVYAIFLVLFATIGIYTLFALFACVFLYVVTAVYRCYLRATEPAYMSWGRR